MCVLGVGLLEDSRSELVLAVGPGWADSWLCDGGPGLYHLQVPSVNVPSALPQGSWEALGGHPYVGGSAWLIFSGNQSTLLLLMSHAGSGNCSGTSSR